MADNDSDFKQLVASRSHDLRTPLNAIIGFVQLLAVEDLPGEQADWVTQIEMAANRLVDDLDELLRLARGPQPPPLPEE